MLGVRCWGLRYLRRNFSCLVYSCLLTWRPDAGILGLERLLRYTSILTARLVCQCPQSRVLVFDLAQLDAWSRDSVMSRGLRWPCENDCAHSLSLVIVILEEMVCVGWSIFKV
jgi:hypothetical protein